MDGLAQTESGEELDLTQDENLGQWLSEEVILTSGWVKLYLYTTRIDIEGSPVKSLRFQWSMNIVPFPIQWISMRLIQINKDHCKWDFRSLLNFPPWKIDIKFRLIFCYSSCGITARDFAKYDDNLRSYQNLTGINNSAFKEMWDAGISNRKFEWPWEMKLTRCYIWFKLLYDLKTPMHFKIHEILDRQQPVIV